jgi:hypothetical protein
MKQYFFNATCCSFYALVEDKPQTEYKKGDELVQFNI